MAKRFHFKQRSNKYNATATTVDGIRFDSAKEATYYSKLKLLQSAGEVSHFHRQVPIDLPGGVKYRVDFLVFFASGELAYVDVKGHQTKEFLLKKKQVEALYPIQIEIV